MSAPRPGTYVVIRFGSRGTQLAEVVRYTRGGTRMARRWQANSRRWTKPSVLMSDSIIRLANRDDIHKFKS